MPSERIEDSGTSPAAGAGVQRQPRTSPPEQSQDPATIVAEIEATREDLAETLDAIAERVSPKRVAKRSSDRFKVAAAQAKELVSERAATAKVVVQERTATAKVVVQEKAATAKVAVSDKAATAKETVGERAATAKQAVADRTGHGGTGVPAAVLDSPPALATPTTVTSVTTDGLTPDALATGPLSAGPRSGAAATLPPTTGVEVPVLAPRPGASTAGPTVPAQIAGLPREVVAGGLAALVALWLLLRRRKG